MPLDGQETQRRARAMLAYANIELRDMAERLGISEDTMSRHAGKRGDYVKTPRVDYLTGIADACELPVEFFYADLERLGEIVPDDAVVIGRREAMPAERPLFRDERASDVRGSEAG